LNIQYERLKSYVDRVLGAGFRVTGALAAGIFYIICWLAAFLPIGSAPHMYIALLTNAEMTSSAALIQGLSWSIVFGLIAGSLLSLIYNILAPLERS
jgi:hypothetical protein